MSQTLPIGSIIESAGSRFASRSSNRSTGTQALGQERAMARRLEQLHTALGETEASSASTQVVQVPIAPPARRTFGLCTLMVTATLSALLGAAGMSLAAQWSPPAPAPKPAAVALPASTIAVPAPVVASPAITTTIPAETQVGQLLENWRQAWSQRDISSYLGAYSSHFAPADGSTRASWVAARTKKLAAGAPIDLQIRELVIKQHNAEQFQASFVQDYVSGSYREIGRTKTLLIVRENGEWKISREWIADDKAAAR